MVKQYTSLEMRYMANAIRGQYGDDSEFTDVIAMLRQAADEIEREKKYEYTVRYKNGELSCLRDTKPFKDDCLKLANDVDRLHAENARLKAALQPVLDCDVTKESYLAQSEVVWIAQRIWKEGEKQ